MAQRKEARIFVTIWDDPAFRALPPGPQRMYMYLLSQIDLSYCGVISLRERRWASDAAGLTIEQVKADLSVLAEPFPEGIPEGFPEGSDRPLVVIDEDAGELLVRSLIRNDGIWMMPNFFKAARESATLIRSTRIKIALLEELHRIPVDNSGSPQVKAILAEFTADLERALNTRPSNPSAKGSRNPSANPSGIPTAKGSQGNRGVLLPADAVVPPIPETPPPPRAPTHVPAQARASGEPTTDEPDQLEALIAEVRAIRPDWSQRAILRALTRPKITARPIAAVHRAMLAVARDPSSQKPGRLEHDGRWWDEPPPRPTRPPWCGTCIRETRRLEHDDGTDAGRCPTCHPNPDQEPT